MGNPLSAEAGMLRPSLAPGMATMLALNLHRDVSGVRLFEMGTVFGGSTSAVTETVGLALGATGAAVATALYKAEDALFYEVKGALEALLAKFEGVVTFDGNELPAWVSAGRGARVLVDGDVVGVFGELSAAELQARKLRQPCVVASVDAQRLLGAALRQPVVIESALHAADAGLVADELRSVQPVEIFRDAKGKTVAVGSYSLLLRAVFQSNERTLTEDEIMRWMEWVVAKLKGLGGAQRA
jgi:phenylalanyl-tRNA synthetase beta chain